MNWNQLSGNELVGIGGGFEGIKTWDASLTQGGASLVDLGNIYSKPLYLNPNGSGLDLSNPLVNVNQPIFSDDKGGFLDGIGDIFSKLGNRSFFFPFVTAEEVKNTFDKPLWVNPLDNLGKDLGNQAGDFLGGLLNNPNTLILLGVAVYALTSRN